MDRSFFLKNSARLEYFTIAWNVIAAITGFATGISAGSIALAGFGLDNAVAIAPTSVLLWRLRVAADERHGEFTYSQVARRALFVAGVAYFLLSLYLLNESASRLSYQWKADVTVSGLVLAVLSVFILPLLALLKFRAATMLGRRIIRVNARKTLVCGYLSLILLVGLGCNAWLGWWWADPVAVLLMVPLIARKGWRAVEESKGTPSLEAKK